MNYTWLIILYLNLVGCIIINEGQFGGEWAREECEHACFKCRDSCKGYECPIQPIQNDTQLN